MLASPRFRAFVLIAVPCVVFIYLLQRNSEYGASRVIDSFHHYTQKWKDLGAIEAVQEHAQKWSEALPWNTKVELQDDHMEETTNPYLDHIEDTTPPYVDYTQGSTEPYVDYTGGATTSYGDYAEDPAAPQVDYTGGAASPYVDDAGDTALPYVDYLDDAVLPSSPAPISSVSHSDANSLLDITSSSHASTPNTPVSAALKLPYLQELCRETNWMPGLWLQCTSYAGPNKTSWSGGLNNGRTRLQNCLRLAIDAGAGVILPQIYLRGVGTADATVYGHDACADDWFDLAYTDLVMRTNCPQLELRANCPDATGRLVSMPPPPSTDLGVIRTPLYLGNVFSKGEFRQNIVLANLHRENRINASSGGLVDGTTILEYGDTFLGWSYSKSNEFDTVRKDLYKTIRFQERMHEIGEKIRDSQQLHHGSYIAVHLRGESDWPPEWGSTEQQMALYIDEMAKIRATDEGRNVSVVFVSSGEQGVIQAFRDKLQPLNYTVHDKWTLLADFPGDVAQVEQADFDAMGIVDDAVLVGAMYFMGIWMSTFSQNVAIARTINDEEDFLNSAIFRNGVKQPGSGYQFQETPTLQGNNLTKLIVFSGLQPEIA